MSQNIENALTNIEADEERLDADEVLRLFRARTGAGLHFRNGTNELTYCGVKGTATSGAPAELLRSWKRAARRKLERKAGVR